MVFWRRQLFVRIAVLFFCLLERQTNDGKRDMSGR